MPLGSTREGQPDATTRKSGDLPDMHPRKGCVNDAGVCIGPVPSFWVNGPVHLEVKQENVPGLARRDEGKTL